MSTKTTRRSVLAGAAALPLASLPAIAAAHPDAELLALGRKLNEATQEWNAASGPQQAAHDRIFAAKPDMETCTQEEWNRWADVRDEAIQCFAAEPAKIAWEAAVDKEFNTAREILMEWKAQTLDGLYVKVQAIEALSDGNGTGIEAEEWWSIADDIRRLAGKAVQS
jgi:hypothetical protein